MPLNRPDETHGRPIKTPGKKGMLSFPSGFPGQLGLLAQQMNNGFGGGLLAQRNYLNQIYSPMQMPAMPDLGGLEEELKKKKKDEEMLNPDGTPINTWRVR